MRRGVDPQHPVTWHAVALWAEIFSCSVPQMEGLQEGIIILDSVFVPYMRARVKAEQDKAKPK